VFTGRQHASAAPTQLRQAYVFNSPIIRVLVSSSLVLVLLLPAGNTPGEASINLGRQAVSANTGSLGARAVAGSGTMHTADAGATVTANIMLLTPRKVVNEGSVAFTDRAYTAAAVAGLGDGPVAMARANEVAAMARAERDAIMVGEQRDWVGRQNEAHATVAARTQSRTQAIDEVRGGSSSSSSDGL
jgi:hypothetical protein